jgi:hypothetical protein
MKQTIYWVYSVLFRFGGLVMAIMSAIVSVGFAIEIAKDGYILVNGVPSNAFSAIATAVGMPLGGVVFGLSLFYFVPKVRRNSN